MKKQILFLILFIATTLIAVNSYGQAGPAKPYQNFPTAAPVCLTPTPFTGDVCNADELHPVQGTVYTYTITTTSATDDVRWFVVNNNDLAPDSLLSAVTGILPSTDTRIEPSNGTGEFIYGDGTTSIANYNINPVNDDATGTTKSIDIAWKYFDGVTNQVILVAYVEDNAGCTNNIGVYRIIPKPAFTIDIASVLENGSNPAGPSDANNSECVSPIESAIYSGSGTTPDGTLTVDYGENWVFFVVNGANYFDSWMPEFQLSYTGGTAPVAEASWAYLGDAVSSASSNWHTLTGSGALSSTATTWTGPNPVIAGASAAAPGTVGDGVIPAAGGECIVVRVRLDWGTDIEHDQAPGTLTFAANGIAYDGAGTTTAEYYDDRTNFEDLHYDNCLTDGFTNDVVDYDITERPEAVGTSPDTEDKTGDGVN